ncbi:hypothetical protein B296_00044094, partial [Ensete ventricosum]
WTRSEHWSGPSDGDTGSVLVVQDPDGPPLVFSSLPEREREKGPLRRTDTSSCSRRGARKETTQGRSVKGFKRWERDPRVCMSPPAMDSFGFLKYLRSGGNATSPAMDDAAAATEANNAGATIATSVLLPSDDTEEDDDDDHDQDEGPFFDLEFAAVTDDGGGVGEEEKNGSEVDLDGAEAEGEEEEREFNFAVSSDGSGGGDGGDGHGFDTFSPSHDDLFFKGKLVPFDASSIVIAAAAAASEADPKPQFHASFLRTATKFRVFLLGLRKPKPTPAEPNAAAVADAEAPAPVPAEAPAPAATEAAASPKKQLPHQNKFFIKFKVVEAPIVSFFARDSSSRSGGSGSSAPKPLPSADEATVAGVAATEAEEKKLLKEVLQKYLNKIKPRLPPPPTEESAIACAAAAEAEEKKLVKEVVQKYINKIKPLYVRVSRRYAERLRLAGQLPPAEAVAEEATTGEGEETDAEAEIAVPQPRPPTTTVAAAGGGKSLVAGLRVVCKRLGKSRSASSAVEAIPSPPPSRRDDSLLQQQDGIQSAIAHCKRSFTAAEQGTFLARHHAVPIIICFAYTKQVYYYMVLLQVPSRRWRDR